MLTLREAVERLLERLGDAPQFRTAAGNLRQAVDSLGAEPGSPELRQVYIDIDEALAWLHGQRVDVREARRARMGPILRPPQVGTPLDAARVALGIVELLWLTRQNAARYHRESQATAPPLRAVGTAIARAVKDAEDAPSAGARKDALARVAVAIRNVYPVLLPTEAAIWPLLAAALRIVEGRSGEPRSPGG